MDVQKIVRDWGSDSPALSCIKFAAGFVRTRLWTNASVYGYIALEDLYDERIS